MLPQATAESAPQATSESVATGDVGTAKPRAAAAAQAAAGESDTAVAARRARGGEAPAASAVGKEESAVARTLGKEGAVAKALGREETAATRALAREEAAVARSLGQEESALARGLGRGEAVMEKPPPKGMGLKGAPSPITGAVVSLGANLAGTLLTSWMHDKIRESVANMPPPSINRAKLWAAGGVTDRTPIDLLASKLPSAVEEFEADRGRATLRALAFWNALDRAPADQRIALLDSMQDAVWRDQAQLLQAQSNVDAALELEPLIREQVQAAADLQKYVDNPWVFEKLATWGGFGLPEISAISSNLAWYQASLTRGTLVPLQQLRTRLQQSIDGNDKLLEQLKAARQPGRIQPPR
jgi:hypothetical protein